MSALSIFTLASGGWLLLNGLLHDIFVLASPKGKTYDRELLRLLLDGHILVTCGVLVLFCVRGVMAGQQWAYAIAFIAALSMLVYCAMIFPFLKSFGTILVCTALAVCMGWKLFGTA